ncbi:MAG: hypothetical protein KJ065_11475 [Anaerolineae bacterium]|nr:hypothetical protein [Anaerolineae bacterium]
MSTTTREHPRLRQRSQQNVAWGILWIALGLFFLTVALASMGIYYFLFRSTVPLQSQLQVSRGTLGVTGTDLIEQVVRGDRQPYLLFGDVITVNPDSQGLLLIDDVRLEDAPYVAALTLSNDSSVTLNEAARPRYDWSSQPYTLDLGNVAGEVSVLISEQSEREVRIALTTRSGDSVILTSPGEYLVTARGEQLAVSNISGTALLVTDDRNSNRAVPAGQRGLLTTTNNEISLEGGYVNLLGERGFRETNIVADAASSAAGAGPNATPWICSSPPHDPPRGSYGIVNFDGRTTLHIIRDGGAQTHGETRCTKYFGAGTTGIDISDHSYLALRVTFYVAGQSLAVCGVAGTECPLMVNMQYIPQNTPGAESAASLTVNPATPEQPFGPIPVEDIPVRNWHHGFYTVPAGSIPSPLRCDTCPQEHSFIRQGRWFTYDTGNLLALFPQEQKPGSILSFSFYASGHEYDVYVSEVALLVDTLSADSEQPAG